ncbi:unnamed protein product [Sphagnum balticum]
MEETLCLKLLYPLHRRLLSTVSMSITMWTVFRRCYSELACSSLESVGVHCSSPLHEAKTVSLKNSYCRKLWLICLHLNSKHEWLLEFLLCCVHHALVLLFNAIPENLFSEVDEAQKPR